MNIQKVAIGCVLVGVTVFGSVVGGGMYLEHRDETLHKESVEAANAERDNRLQYQRTLADSIALEGAADMSKLDNGTCPEDANELVGKYVKRMPKSFIAGHVVYEGNCEFSVR